MSLLEISKDRLQNQKENMFNVANGTVTGYMPARCIASFTKMHHEVSPKYSWKLWAV